MSTHPSSTVNAPTIGRSVWADIAKGLSILLVVLGHAAGILTVLGPDVTPSVLGAWNLLITALSPVRVPLFFLISGYFAKRALTRPWAAVFSSRVGKNLYVYALWVALLGLFFNFVLFPPFGGVDYSPGGVLAQFVIPVSHPWYLYALAVYFLIAKAVRRVPVALVLGGAAVLYMLAGMDWQPLPQNLLRGLLFFLIGAYAPAAIEWASTKARLSVVLGLVSGYVALALLIRILGVSEIAPALLALTCVAVPTALQVIVRLPPGGWVARLFNWLGQRTLPIYLMHFPVLVALAYAFQTVPFDRLPTSVSAGLYALIPIVAASVAVLVTVGVHRLLLRLPCGEWLFTLPMQQAPKVTSHARSSV